jgi:hypothetical protein
MVSSVIPFMASSDAKSRLDICSFWVVEALTRASRKEEVRLMFEEMLGYSNLGEFLRRRSVTVAKRWDSVSGFHSPERDRRGLQFRRCRARAS